MSYFSHPHGTLSSATRVAIFPSVTPNKTKPRKQDIRTLQTYEK